MKPKLLVVAPMEERHHHQAEAEFDIAHAAWADLETIRRLGAQAEGVWTNGTIGLSGEAIANLPSLRIIVAQGAGVENIDVGEARRRGIVVTNGAGTNARCVADHAVALLLALVRDVPRVDRLARTREWASLKGSRPTIYGKSVGIVGMGRVGREIAKRVSGFDASVAYHARHPVPELPYTFVANLVELAKQSDFLLLACPGGPGTFRIVNAAVLEALGSAGYLVNVARGTVIDTAALVEALRGGRVAGAALDVFENEPGIPEVLLDIPNLVLTPHLAGSAPEVRDDQVSLALDNFKAFFAGRPLTNVIS